MFLSTLLFNTNIFAFTLSTPVQISDGSINSTAATIVSNSSDQAAATWTTWDYYGANSVQVATYTSGTWGTPTTLGNGVSSVVSINGSGDAVAAWMNPVYPTYEGVLPQIWGATYNHYSGSSSTPVQISNTTTQVSTPSLIVNDAGNAIVMWTERCACTETCSCSLVACSMYSSSTFTWATPTNFTSCESHTKSAENATLFVNGFGNVMTFWAERHSSSGTLTIMAKAYENSSWNIASEVTSNAVMRKVCYGGIDESGKAMVVWLADTDNGANIQASTYSQGTWSTPYVVMDEPRDFFFAYGLGGTGILAWNVITDEGNIINAMTYSNGTWSSATNISSQVGNGGAPCVAAGDTNNGAIMWGNGTDNGYIEIMSYSDGSWTHVLSEPVNLQRSPVVYNLNVNSSGQIMASWDDTAVDGTNVIMSSKGTI
jgi:hypothetical protein